MADHVAFYRKWRPLTFGQVVGQQHITRALKTQVETGRTSHAYLFTGTRGTGKTTCARILARAVNCLNPIEGEPCNECEACAAMLADSALDVTEIDAASNNGVDNIREMREEAFYTPASLRFRVYIIDEVHMLSPGAFNALLKTLEEPPAHVKFILATTEIHKVPATILSRCQKYDFRRIPPEIIASLLEDIANGEGIALEPGASSLLARLADGSMRDGISLLDRCCQTGTPDTASIAASLGIVSQGETADLMRALISGDAAKALELFTAGYIAGRDIVSLFDELLTLMRDMYILKATGADRFLLSSAAYDIDSLRAMSDSCDTLLLEFFVSCVSDLLRRLTRIAMKRVDGEMCIMKMCLRHAAIDDGVLPSPAKAPVSSAPKETKPPAAAAPDGAPHASDAPPWDDELPASPRREAPQMPEKELAPPKRQPEPVRKQSGAPASSGPANDQLMTLVTAVRPKVNSAVSTYLSLAEAQNIDNILNIYVAEESLIFIEKPAVLDILSKAAADMGLSGVKIAKKTTDAKPADADTPGGGLLSHAESLGIKIVR